MADPQNGGPPLSNQTPDSVQNAISAVWQYVEQYGWLAVVIAVALLYLKSHLQSKFEQWQKQREDNIYKKIDAGEAQSRLEAMEKQRQRMQEMMDKQAEEYKQKQKEKEEKARLERIADWEQHQQGKGYKSKIRTRDDSEAGSSQQKPKPKKPLRDTDYSPLAGGGGGACYRPSRRGPTGGGG